MWKNSLKIEVVYFSQNHIDATVFMEEREERWRLTGVYGYLEGNMKIKTSELLRSLYRDNQEPWLCFGDFNLMLSVMEKQGRNPPNQHHVEACREALACCELMEIENVGTQFTWVNGQVGEASIQAKLDRFVATQAWRELFNEAEAHHLL